MKLQNPSMAGKTLVLSSGEILVDAEGIAKIPKDVAAGFLSSGWKEVGKVEPVSPEVEASESDVKKPARKHK